MERHLAEFSNWLRSEGRSGATIRKHCYSIAAFLRWRACAFPDAPITRGLLRDFGAALKDRSLRPSTQHGYAAALSVFFHYLTSEAGITGLPDVSALSVDAPDPPERLAPSSEEAQAMLRAARQMPAHTTRAAYLRGRALVVVGIAFLAGLRRGEILRLELRDLEKGHLRVRRGKGGKGRRVPVSDELHVILEEWQRTRAAWVREHNYQTEALLPTREGKPMAERGFAAVWSDVRARAGIARRITPHGGRHWFGSMVAGAVGYVEAMTALGHSNIATTQKYLHSDPAKLRAGIAAVGRESQGEKSGAAEVKRMRRSTERRRR